MSTRDEPETLGRLENTLVPIVISWPLYQEEKALSRDALILSRYETPKSFAAPLCPKVHQQSLRQTKTLWI
ncbi:hypothetical protein HZ326_19319 [Fusarium oxysporum f. sp. albedinis]|nr:hypothetical protein HZ326_19319 [Fusarium oxysporum f. sp. albedinis]